MITTDTNEEIDRYNATNNPKNDIYVSSYIQDLGTRVLEPKTPEYTRVELEEKADQLHGYYLRHGMVPGREGFILEHLFDLLALVRVHLGLESVDDWEI